MGSIFDRMADCFDLVEKAKNTPKPETFDEKIEQHDKNLDSMRLSMAKILMRNHIENRDMDPDMELMLIGGTFDQEMYEKQVTIQLEQLKVLRQIREDMRLLTGQTARPGYNPLDLESVKQFEQDYQKYYDKRDGERLQAALDADESDADESDADNEDLDRAKA